LPDCINSKYIPWEFATATSLEQKKFIIEEMVHWDGNHVKNRSQYEYMSIIKHNADVIQAVASMCGYMSTIMRNKSGGNGAFRGGYVYKVSILLKKHNVSTQQFEKHKIYKDVDKNVYCVTVDSGMILVRQNNCISVSGNCDSLALATAGIENVVSVPTGALGMTWVPYCFNWVCKFSEIVVFGDFENGHITLLDDIKKRFPVKIKRVREEDYKGCKDANEILIKHGADAVRNAVDNVECVPIEKIISLADVENVNIYELKKLKTGIADLDRILCGGLPFGTLCLLTGKRGEGKSTLGSQIMANANKQGYVTFTYSGELPNYLYKSWFDFQIAGKDHIQETYLKGGYVNRSISKANQESINNWYRDKAYIYDNRVIDGEEKTNLLQIVERFIQQFGAKVIFLDNLMTAMYLDEIKGFDRYEQQGEFVNKLAKLAVRYDVLIILVAHKRKNGFSKDENDEISGSGDISNLAGVVISYGRDSDLQESQRKLITSKNRIFGRTDTKGIILDYEEKSKRIYGTADNVDVSYGWESLDGFDTAEQMEIPF